MRSEKQWLCRGLLALSACLVMAGCSEDEPAGQGNNDLDMGSDRDVSGEDIPTTCETSADCAGRVCVEGACADCLEGAECASNNLGDTCQGGLCCQSGEAGCACGPGASCGPDLACQGGACVACPAGSEGCACGQGDACGPDLACEGDTCVSCPVGSQGCACDEQGGCRDELACMDGACALPQPASCLELGCAEQGRVCEMEPVPSCGGCDTENGYIADTDGTCLRVEGDPCDSDAQCMDGQRCLKLLVDQPSVCTPVPSCVDSQPAQGQGAAWSPVEGACVSCAPCTGMEGATGAIWPTTTLEGDCVCETQPGFYYDIALGTSGARVCDGDGDGWVQQPAEQFVNSQDPVLSRNARCDVTLLSEIVLRNERGETRSLSPQDLGASGLVLGMYEPEDIDTDENVAAADEILAWGAQKPAAAQLNPLTKLCVGSLADFNANGVSDVREHAGSTPRQSWMAPWVKLSHFGELHRVAVDGQALVISEIPRCDPDFPMDFQGEAPGWQECLLRRPRGYGSNRPGYDFAQWSCDDSSGSCPAALDPADGLPLRNTCSAEPLAGFTGMNLHSLFRCQEFVGTPQEPHQLSLAQAVGRTVDVNRCRWEEGALRCDVLDPEAEGGLPQNGDVAWSALRSLSPSGDDYVAGCQEQCGVLLPTCEGYDQGLAGCTNNSANFGELVCNACPGSGQSCTAPDLVGACAAGSMQCDGDGVGAELICVPRLDEAQRAAQAMLEDRFEDDADTNCDGFRGNVSQSIFVVGSRNRDRTPEGAIRVVNIERALDYIDENAGTWSLYILAMELSTSQEVVIPPAVDSIYGGMVGSGCATSSAPGDWCVDPEGGRTTLRATQLTGLVVGERSVPLHIHNLDVQLIAPARPRGSRNGTSLVGMRVEGEATQVVLHNSSIVTPDALPGLDGEAHAELSATSGQDGEEGSAGCQRAAGFCGGECPGGYWTSGKGAACTCGGEPCAGGDGGVGGTAVQGCSNPMVGEEASNGEMGQAGPGAAPALGGMASMQPPNCDPELDNNPEDSEVGMLGADGVALVGMDGMPGAGFFHPDLGWVARAGTDGVRGPNGGGGGGGAGGVGSGAQVGGCPNRGGHGGGGGSGGCGGAGGQAGGSGGGSFAVMLLGGEVVLDNSTLQAGNGGNGGNGVAGQMGGAGGLGGRRPGTLANQGHAFNEALQDDARNGARGGDGGVGAPGTPGGAGVGGPSAAILVAPGVNVPLATESMLCGQSGANGASDSANQPQQLFVVNDCILSADNLVYCEQDIDCGIMGGGYCLGSYCEPLVGNGGPCEEDRVCGSGYCKGDTCADRMELGQTCDVDEDCTTGLCWQTPEPHTCQEPCLAHTDCDQPSQRCGFELVEGERGACTAAFGDGASCGEDDDCDSGFCSGRGYCATPCNNNRECGQGRWCNVNLCEDLVGTGGECSVSDQCVSGACSVGARCLECDEHADCVDNNGERDGYCSLNVCQPLKNDGIGCTIAAECSSGICDVQCTACTANSDCDAGNNEYCKVVTLGQNSCRPRIADGGACAPNDECRAGLTCDQGFCRDTCSSDGQCESGEFCGGGACRPKLEIGVACGTANEDNRCASGVCDVSCVACRANGDGCSSSQYCDIGVPVIATDNTCRARGTLGQSCGVGSPCISGLNCNEGVCRRACSSDSQCSRDEFCHVNACAPKLGNGEFCAEARVCESGICNTAACRECDSNDDCSGYCALFQCEPTKANGQGCGNNFECTSGFCSIARTCATPLESGAICLTNAACRSGRCVFRVIPPVLTCD